MRKYDENGIIAEGYFIDEDKFIPRGRYKETELDGRKKTRIYCCSR